MGWLGEKPPSPAMVFYNAAGPEVKTLLKNAAVRCAEMSGARTEWKGGCVFMGFWGGKNLGGFFVKPKKTWAKKRSPARLWDFFF